MTMYKCLKCGIDKPKTRENFHRSNLNGKEFFHKVCRDCRTKEKLESQWKDGKLLCKVCKEFLTIDQFSISKKTGSHYRDDYDSRCKSCRTKQSFNNRKCKTGDGAVNRVLKERFLGARLRASKNNLDFNITEEFLMELLEKQQRRCAISNVEFTYELGSGRIPTNISIDKTDSHKGYTMDNIQLVCMAVNQMKNDLTMEQLLFFCTSIINNAKKWKH